MCYNTRKILVEVPLWQYFHDFSDCLCAPIGDSHTEYSLCGSSAVGGDY